MIPMLNRTRLALQVTAIAASLLFAAACSDSSPAVPTDTTVTDFADAAANAPPRTMQLVVMRPVMAPGPNGEVRKSYVTKVVQLRPVMKGEPLPPPDN